MQALQTNLNTLFYFHLLITLLLANEIDVINCGNNDLILIKIAFLQIFNANNDSDGVVTNKLYSPILARYIRVRPNAWNQLGSICLRLELYGCQVTQGRHKITLLIKRSI